MKKGRILWLIVGVLVLCLTVAGIVHHFVPKQSATMAEEYAEFLVNENASFILPPETNIRSDHNTGSDAVETIISQNRDYTWYFQVGHYYKITDFKGRVWYGIDCQSVNLDDCPEKLAKWCARHQQKMIWFAVEGGARLLSH